MSWEWAATREGGPNVRTTLSLVSYLNHCVKILDSSFESLIWVEATNPSTDAFTMSANAELMAGSTASNSTATFPRTCFGIQLVFDSRGCLGVLHAGCLGVS